MKKAMIGQCVVLTGASSGIGRELTKILIRKYGVSVIGIGRSEQKMQSLIAELGELANRFSYRIFDVGNRENWLSFAAESNSLPVPPSVLINNAGAFPSFSRSESCTSEVFEQILSTNFMAVKYSVDAMLPILRRASRPTIVNVASSAALCPIAGTAAYSASKSALKSYTQALSIECGRSPRVCLIMPGTTRTELFRNAPTTKNSALDAVAMSAHKMAAKIARAIYRRKRYKIIGIDAHFMNAVAKLMPDKGPRFISWIMKKSGSKVFSDVFDSKK